MKNINYLAFTDVPVKYAVSLMGKLIYSLNDPTTKPIEEIYTVSCMIARICEAVMEAEAEKEEGANG